MIHPEISHLLTTVFTTRHYPKDALLVRQGQVCQDIFFVEKGLLKVVAVSREREFIMRFFAEYSFVTIVDSFTEQQPSFFQLVALEDCEVRMLHRTAFEKICAENLEAANQFRKINQWVAANMMKRIRELLENDARGLYQKFLNEHAAIVQRISLGDLAKYLGITQVSLSRIRAQQ